MTNIRVGVILRQSNRSSNEIKIYAMSTDTKYLRQRTKDLNTRPSNVSDLWFPYFKYIFAYKYIKVL